MMILALTIRLFLGPLSTFVYETFILAFQWGKVRGTLIQRF